MVDNCMWNCCNCYLRLWPWQSNVVKQWKRSWVHSVINCLSYCACQFILWSHHVHCRRPDYSIQLLQWECTRKYSSVFTCSINQTLLPDTRQLSSLYPQQSHQFYESWAFSLVYHETNDRRDPMTLWNNCHKKVLNHRVYLAEPDDTRCNMFSAGNVLA